MTADFGQSRFDPQAEIAELERVLQQIRARIEARIGTSATSWAVEQYRQRRRRNAIFAEDADLFGEPTWDVLLDLFAAHQDGRPISISSACIAADVAPTTALRQLTRLQTRGLIQRHGDTRDRRRHYLQLTDRAITLLMQVQEATS